MQDLIRQLETLVKGINTAITQLNIEADRTAAAGLRKRTLDADFWSDTTAASDVSRRLAALDRHIDSWGNLLADATEALELARLEQHAADSDLTDQIRSLYDKAQA